MARDTERLDGWKAIGAHFGRDRTTAIRWARDRGLPVRSMPGGKTRTVYALRSELDGWARQYEEASAPEPLTPLLPASVSSPSTSVHRRNLRPWLTGGGLALGGSVMLLLVTLASNRSPPRAVLPADHATAALYVQGRDEAARRDAASLGAAVQHLREVTRRTPTFAPAWASLADAELLMREYGSESEELGYVRARAAAEQALRLDADLPAAWRALGFLAYWTAHDRRTAARNLHEALRRDPDDAQTRFWIANILADNGEFAAAERHYDAARLRDPGSLPIRTEQAWARWSAGRTDGEAELRTIARQHPENAVVHECLSMIRLAAGDWPGYLAALRIRASLRADPAMTGYAARAARAFAQDGVPGLRDAILHDVVDKRDLRHRDPALAALFLSAAGDRPALLDLLARAETERQVWGWAGYRRVMAERWRDDGVMTALLAHRAPPPMAGVVDGR